MLGAFCMSMAYITIRQIGAGEDPLVVTLYFSAVGIVVVPILAALSQGFGDAALWTPRVAALELVVGVTGFLGQLLLNRGMALSPAGPATVMRYADVVFALVFQATVINKAPEPLKVLGTFAIMSCLCSTLYNQFAKEQAKKAAAEAEASKGKARTEGLAVQDVEVVEAKEDIR
jgi:drug/metabolite transporter (DMT)-like permease